jgi:hypothetical protein
MTKRQLFGLPADALVASRDVQAPGSGAKRFATGYAFYAEFEERFRFTDKGNFRRRFHSGEFFIFFNV